MLMFGFWGYIGIDSDNAAGYGAAGYGAVGFGLIG